VFIVPEKKKKKASQRLHKRKESQRRPEVHPSARDATAHD